MELPNVKNLPVEGKKVLLRVDFDVPLNPLDAARIEKSLTTIKYLLEKKAKIIIISHLGRPGGKIVPELSLRPISKLIFNFKFSIFNQFLISNFQTGEFSGWKLNEQIVLLQNLRFWPEEEKNDADFAKKLASLADFYVNEAFAVSHRKHASIVGIPKYLPSAFGLSFIEEVEVLSKIRNKPRRSVVLILGGAKGDKLDQIDKLAKWADWVLVGGKLPKRIKNSELSLPAGKAGIKNLRVAKLNEQGKDISQASIADFKKIIRQSRTVVWAGPMGIYEEEKFATGTRETAQAIIESSAYSVVGGGDTQAALTKLGFDGKMSYISSGGGAMLEFLAKGTLAGIEAIINKDDRMTR